MAEGSEELVATPIAAGRELKISDCFVFSLLNIFAVDFSLIGKTSLSRRHAVSAFDRMAAANKVQIAIKSRYTSNYTILNTHNTALACNYLESGLSLRSVVFSVCPSVRPSSVQPITISTVV